MYSVVLATMLSAGTADPGFFGKGCWSCSGCYGYYCHGCGSCYGGWSCGGCHGCYSGCSGCWSCGGGCYSSYSYCYGGCYGCYSSCHGCYSSGCYGGWSCSGCGGCYGGCYGAVIVAPAAPAGEKLPAPGKTSMAPANAATVIVKAPMDVTVTVDGKPTDRTAAEQSFVTPTLEPGKQYVYVFKAEAKVEGETLTREQRVIVQAGREAVVDFNSMTADAPARVTFVMPADTKLTIDGQPFNAGSQRTFDTPALKVGKTYTYTVKAESMRDGQPVSETQKIEVKAGKTISVEFKELTNLVTAGR